MRHRIFFLFSFGLLVGMPNIFAKDFFLTIGGGYSPSGNQASLEKNVLFFQRVLGEENIEGFRHDIYFSDGRAAGRDLQVMDRESVPQANRFMAEFFGSQNDLGLSYRNHQIPDVRADTNPDNIGRWFKQIGSTMQAGDRLCLYVTAHGNRSSDRSNPYNTTIATWNNTSVKMTDLVRLLDRLPQDVEVVAVMVQCHSGGFARFIFKDGDPDQGLAPQRRIGFFATVHDRAAAGCTSDVDEASYVEYSTFFWAALAGHDRSGQVMELPDYNEDGVVSFDEAHAYTVLTADTIDLPIKTSGEFLSVYSKFGENDSDLLTKNESYKVLVDLATPSQRAVLDGLSEQLELSGSNRLAEARKQTQPRRDQGGRGRFRGRRPESPESQLRRRIGGDLERRWPGLANVLNPIAVELITSRSAEFIDAIEEHPEYRRYRELCEQEALSEQEKKVKYERFLRTADNVLLAENLRRMNDEDKLAQYEALRSAEAATLARQ